MTSNYHPEIIGGFCGLVKVKHFCQLCGEEVIDIFSRGDYFNYGDSIFDTCRFHLDFFDRKLQEEKAERTLKLLEEIWREG